MMMRHHVADFVMIIQCCCSQLFIPNQFYCCIFSFSERHFLYLATSLLLRLSVFIVMLNLREKQLQALGSILSLNNNRGQSKTKSLSTFFTLTFTISSYSCVCMFVFLVNEASEEYADQWKVLIYDQDCRDIISPLMNVGGLRSKGVTLHLLVSV